MIQKQFQKNGFAILDKVIDQKSINILNNHIKINLQKFAQELKIDLGVYAYCTGRWAPPSLMFDHSIYHALNKEIQNTLQNVLHKSITLKKQNIICKNQHLTDGVPLHQDISYSYNAPYSFSFWLALDDVSEHTGEIIVLEQSHKWPIEPAVDFWSPFFQDTKWNKYINSAKKIYLNSGDGLIFDSCLWHGSVENKKQVNRYAYVTRWIIDDYEFPAIPLPIPLEFGMWNCHEQSITKCNQFLQNQEKSSFIELINKCIQQLEETHDHTIPQKQVPHAIIALKNLITLHQASTMHNAGDLCGQVYKNVWLQLFNC